ncbi:hypothetical protein A2U01_0012842, partial [Trifolium medium]|nr:hypothetical protein [Trifolium medium]
MSNLPDILQAVQNFVQAGDDEGSAEGGGASQSFTAGGGGSQ